MDVEDGSLELVAPGEDVELARIFDASGNRVREGLRVVEDYVRFALDDPALTKRLKDVRHRFSHASQGLDASVLLVCRDTPNDVGTKVMTVEERLRENPRAVLAANFKRMGEALRSMEEFAKLKNVWLAGKLEVLRYDVYTLEKQVMIALGSRRSLANCRLYLLVGGLPTLGDLEWVVAEAIEGGVDVVQLREKAVPDRELLRRAVEIRIRTAEAQVKFIVNNRPDLARLAGADGVHVGQEDLKVKDARKLVGPNALIGVSTHAREQIDQAVLDGAGYFAVGPVFASGTKTFDAQELVGLGLVRQATEHQALPWFAIGGIGPETLDEVLEAGAERVAVGSAIVQAASPRRAARDLRRRIDERLGPTP
jgi:thiamine-phosphate pyrophosphorylase